MGGDPKKPKVDINKLVKSHDNPSPKPTTGRLTIKLNEKVHQSIIRADSPKQTLRKKR